MTKLQFAESVAATCKRPAAYTLHGTLPEVIANLDGFAQGIGLQHGSHSGIGGSFEWLATKLGKETTRGDELLLTFGDEQTALRELARLYREYAELEDAVQG